MTIKDRAKSLFCALEANTDGRKAAIAMIAQALCGVAEDCEGVADRRAELEKGRVKEFGLRANKDGLTAAQAIGEEICALKEEA